MKIRNGLLLLLLLCLMTCTALADAPYTVLATTYPLYDMAVNVCGDLAEVLFVSDASNHEHTAADIVLGVDADADAWAAKLPEAKIFKAVEGLDLIDGDTDALTVPVHCMICASRFADLLYAVDPDNNTVYQDNLEAYVNAMSEIDLHIRDVVSPGLTICCDDGSMAYFAREYDLTLAADDQSGAVLSTFNHPAEDLLQTPYVQLIHANLHRLTDAAD